MRLRQMNEKLKNCEMQGGVPSMSHLSLLP